MSLVLRLYDPDAGSVSMDGHLVKEFAGDGSARRFIQTRSLNLKWLREQVAVVEQTTTLFPGTIFENIAMGKGSATLDEVVHAARLVRTVRRPCIVQ